MRNRKHLRVKVIILNRKVNGVKKIKTREMYKYIYYGVGRCISSIMFYYNTERREIKIYHFQVEEKQK